MGCWPTRLLGLGLALLLVSACPPDDSGAPRTPAGTPTDPVERCETLGQVCRIDQARLGVCNEVPPERCASPGPCFRCVPQH